MTDAVLIDSSAWTQALRRNGDSALRAQAEALVAERRAAWCEIVRVELWKGAGSREDSAKIERLEQLVINMPLTQEIWNATCTLAQRARLNGTPVPTTDMIIFACAQLNGLKILHRDKHFDLLERLPVIK